MKLEMEMKAVNLLRKSLGRPQLLCVLNFWGSAWAESEGQGRAVNCLAEYWRTLQHRYKTSQRRERDLLIQVIYRKSICRKDNWKLPISDEKH